MGTNFIKATILTEFGSDIGFGHLSRCEAIKSAFLTFKVDIKLIAIDGVNKARAFYSKKEPIKTDLLLIDSYLIHEDEIEAITKKAKVSGILDDFNRISYPVNLIFNPAIKKLNYSNQNAKIYGGAEFVIIRDEIKLAKKNSKKENIVVVTLGGTNQESLVLEIINALDSLLNDYKIVVIARGLKGLKNNNKIISFGYLKIEELIRFFLSAKFVISGCGQTLNELAYLKVPTIGVLLAKNQENNAIGYLEAGFLKTLIEPQKEILPQLSHAIASLKKPKKEFISGNGSLNIVKKMIEELKSGSIA